MKSEYIIIIPSIIAAIASIAVGILSIRLNKKKEELALIQSKVSEDKYKTYTEVLNIFFNVFKSVQNIKTIEQSQTREQVIDAAKLLLIYANDDILFEFLKWNKELYIKDSKYHFKIYLDLIVKIRKDMGHPNTKLTAEDILRLIAGEEGAFKNLKEMLFKKQSD